MADYNLYGKVTLDDGKSVIDKEISILRTYPEMVYSKLVLDNNETKQVPFGSVSVCKFVVMRTNNSCLVTLENGSDSVDLTIDDIFVIVDTELSSISITAGNNGANIDILIAGE